MKNKELKTVWKLAEIFWLGAFVLWILETAFFLIYEGWHIKATHPVEIHLDKIVSNMWEFALMATIYFCLNTILNLRK